MTDRKTGQIKHEGEKERMSMRGKYRHRLEDVTNEELKEAIMNGDLWYELNDTWVPVPAEYFTGNIKGIRKTDPKWKMHVMLKR